MELWKDLHQRRRRTPKFSQEPLDSTVKACLKQLCQVSLAHPLYRMSTHPESSRKSVPRRPLQVLLRMQNLFIGFFGAFGVCLAFTATYLSTPMGELSTFLASLFGPYESRSLCVCRCIHLSLYLCVCIYISIYLQIYVSVCLYIYSYIYIYVCISIDLYTHIYIDIYLSWGVRRYYFHYEIMGWHRPGATTGASRVDETILQFSNRTQRRYIVYVFMFTYIYIYVYVCIYIYVHIYIYTCMSGYSAWYTMYGIWNAVYSI